MWHNNWVNAQPNSLSSLKAATKICILGFFLICIQCTCVVYILCSKPLSPSVRNLREMADGRLARHWGKPLFRVTPGQGSDVTTTSAGGSSRRPALLCIPSVSQTCCHGLLWQQLKKRRPRSERRGEQWGLLGRDDRKDNNSIGLTAKIIPLLSCSYTIPPKHLIFAQLLICAPLFMSSLFTFLAAQFTCCCWDYPARQGSRFLLLKQLLRSVCFEHNQDFIKAVEYLLSYPPLFYTSELLLRQLSLMPVKAILCWACIWQALAKLKSKLLAFFA